MFVLKTDLTDLCWLPVSTFCIYEIFLAFSYIFLSASYTAAVKIFFISWIS
jgi:hypothetical protein